MLGTKRLQPSEPVMTTVMSAHGHACDAMVEAMRRKRKEVELQRGEEPIDMTLDDDPPVATTIAHLTSSSIVPPVKVEERGMVVEPPAKKARRAESPPPPPKPTAIVVAPQADTEGDHVVFDRKLHWTHACASTFLMPYAEQLVSCSRAGTSQPLRIAPRAPQSAKRDRGKSKDKHQEQSTWLMLACTNQLDSVHVARQPAGPKSRNPATPVLITDHLHSISTLIYALGARVDAQDSEGWSAVHWLIFSALWLPVGKAVVKSEEVNLNGVTRYTTEVELTLMLLLSASEQVGYDNPCKRAGDIGAQDALICTEEPDLPDAMIAKGHLLDLKDKVGNTALHYAVHKRRVDIVALLLRHGASVEIANAKGTKVYNMVEWQRMKPLSESAKPAFTAAAPASVHPLIDNVDTSVYSAVDRLAERRWGKTEGLRIEQCSYEGETDEGAIKRLLFQKILNDAVEAGDDGDAKLTGKLVQVWQLAKKEGGRMFPLAYRADAFFQSPLQTAVAYEATDTVILRKLLELPFSFHMQSGAPEHPSLCRAVMCNNMEAMKLLQRAGYNINHRDIATGQTALAAVCSTDPSPPEDDAVPEDSEADLLRYAQNLVECGADPLIQDVHGNDALTFCVYFGRLELLKYLISKLPKDRVQKWLTTANKFGCTAMHYGLYRLLPITETDAHLLKFLVSLGGQVDGPQNLAGMTPIQAWTDVDSRHAPQMAAVMGKDLNELRQMLNSHKRRRVGLPGQPAVFDTDLSRGQESSSVVLRSEFETSEADRPQVQYTSVLLETPSSALFIESSGPRKELGDRQLQETVFRFVRGATGRIPMSSLEVRMTAAKGWGLFARKAIRMDDGIEVTGEVIGAWGEEEERSLTQLKANEVFILPKYRLYDRVRVYAIDNSRIGNLTRFINHSCSGANLLCYNENTGRQCVLYATRDIAAGEELTINYGLERVPRSTAVCQCGGAKCEGRLI